ncbi:MAG: hypothetical protein H5T91_00145 [Synergistetes bacterium]|nr:hypothetical protein [Synergistota bacterium]
MNTIRLVLYEVDLRDKILLKSIKNSILATLASLAQAVRPSTILGSEKSIQADKSANAIVC